MDGPTYSSCPSCGYRTAGQTTYYSSGERPGFFARLRNHFRRAQPVQQYHPVRQYQSVPQASCPACQAAPASQPAEELPSTAEPPRASEVVPAAFKTDASVQPQTAAKPEIAADFKVSPVDKKFQEKVGAAEDYSFITGQLAYVHTGAGDVWLLRYGTTDQVDKYAGNVILAPGLDMRNYREGDVVSVEGALVPDQGALYRAKTMTMIVRLEPEF
jgi:hypothetical protein